MMNIIQCLLMWRDLMKGCKRLLRLISSRLLGFRGSMIQSYWDSFILGSLVKVGSVFIHICRMMSLRSLFLLVLMILFKIISLIYNYSMTSLYLITIKNSRKIKRIVMRIKRIMRIVMKIKRIMRMIMKITAIEMRIITVIILMVNIVEC